MKIKINYDYQIKEDDIKINSVDRKRIKITNPHLRHRTHLRFICWNICIINKATTGKSVEILTGIDTSVHILDNSTCRSYTILRHTYVIIFIRCQGET